MPHNTENIPQNNENEHKKAELKNYMSRNYMS